MNIFGAKILLYWLRYEKPHYFKYFPEIFKIWENKNKMIINIITIDKYSNLNACIYA